MLREGAEYTVADVASLRHGIGFHDSARVPLAEALALGLPGLRQSIGYPCTVDFEGADRAFEKLLRGVAENGPVPPSSTAPRARTAPGGALPSC